MQRCFTLVSKNETLGIILLMENKFKNILKKTKAIESDPFFKNFEGALFKDSAWFFHFQESLSAVERKSDQLTPEIKPSIKTEIQSNAISLCEVVFIGDNYDGVGEDLLGKMIQAMKLSSHEFYRFPLNEELESIENLEENLQFPSKATLELLAFIEHKRPKVVVSLGATVTNILLGRREKLSAIRGSFLEKNLAKFHFEFMPVFHPDLLIINPNMKRTAWIDLQKVMERVGKI